MRHLTSFRGACPKKKDLGSNTGRDKTANKYSGEKELKNQSERQSNKPIQSEVIKDGGTKQSIPFYCSVN